MMKNHFKNVKYPKLLLILLLGITLSGYTQQSNHFKNIVYQSDKATISLEWDNLSVKYHYNFIENVIIQNIKECDSVLDIGSGYGHWIEFYQSTYNSHVTFIEISEKMTGILEEKYGKIGYCKPIEDIVINRKFDVINAIGVLHHIMNDKDLHKAIENINKMLLPGGILFIGTRFDHATNEKHRKYRTLDWWKSEFGDITIIRSDPPVHCKKHLDMIIYKKSF